MKKLNTGASYTPKSTEEQIIKKSNQMETLEIAKELGASYIYTPMGEKKYWLLIGTVFNSNAGNYELKFEQQISKFSLKEIIQFYLKTADLANKLHFAAIGTAAEIINGIYATKYDFDFYLLFRYWIITLGESIFRQVLEDPDYLANIARIESDLLHINDFLSLVPERNLIRKNLLSLKDIKQKLPCKEPVPGYMKLSIPSMRNAKPRRCRTSIGSINNYKMN